MTSSRKGRLAPLTGAFATDITTLPVTGPHQLCYYNDGFDANEGFINDQVICHGAANGRDKTSPAPALKQASGSLQVPFDVAQLSFFLPMLCGPATSEVEDATPTPSKWTRTFVSGSETQRLAAFSIPVTDDRWKLVHNAYLNSLTFGVGKQDGYRTMDLGFLVPGVELVSTEPAFSAAGSPVSYTHKKVPGNIGSFLIDGTVVAQLVTGNFNFSNQAELVGLADGEDRNLGLETGDTQVRADLTMRVVNGVAVNDVLDLFKGGSGPSFAGQFSFPLDANASLVVDLPYCKGERRLPQIASAQRQGFSAAIEAFQDSGNPSATFTLVNQEA
ncbi:MAG: phage tail tube protein [Pseudomonadota bacterium]